MDELNKWYESLTYDEAKNILQEKLANLKQNFIAAGYYLKYIRDNKLYLEDGYQTIWEFAEDNYGIKMSTASRWMSMNDKFSVGGNSPCLADEFKPFGKNQLQEMLYLTDDQMEQAEPEMSAKEIRAIRKPEEPPQEREEKPSVKLKEPDNHEIDDEPVAPAQIEGTEAPEPVTAEETGEPEKQSGEIPDGVETVLDDEEKGIDQLSLIRQMLDREKQELEEYIKVNKVDPLPERVLEEKKIIVAALAGMLCDLEEPEDISEVTQPPLPELKNNDQRKEWLRNYKDWGLWYEDRNIGCRYYKYDFENGVRLIAEVYKRNNEHLGEMESCYMHLVGKQKAPMGKHGVSKWSMHETYSKYPNGDTELIEYLKFMQKEEK